MKDISQDLASKPQANVHFKLYLYLSAIESLVVLVYYVIYYSHKGWWQHPTAAGMVIMAGLLLAVILLTSAGRYLSARPQLALQLFSVLAKKTVFTILVSLLVIAFLLTVIFFFQLISFQASPFEGLVKHKPLLLWVGLVALQSLFVLGSQKTTFLDEALSKLSARYLAVIADARSFRVPTPVVKRALGRNWYHVAIWGMMIVYLAVAPSVYSRTFIKDGKPVPINQPLPAATDQIKFNTDRVDPFTYNGQDLFKVLGWSFYLGATDQEQYTRYLILQSNRRTYFFSMQPMERADVQGYFKDLQLNLLQSGFSALISKDSVRIGSYHLGVLFENTSDQSEMYFLSDKVVVRTANQLILEEVTKRP